MEYELLFLDVDGTLKQEPHGVSAKNKEAVKEALRMGKKISIASGRNKDLLMNIVKELKLSDYGDTYTVALNGAHIFENCTGKTLHTEPISLEMTRKLFEKAYELRITCHVYTENYVYFNYNDSQFSWYQKEGCNCLLVDMDREDLGLSEPPLKFYLFSKEAHKLERYKSETDTFLEQSFNAEYSSKHSLEYTSVHASKGLGMEYVCGLLQKPLSRAIAAGDGENDISMIKMAGLGIAMKNGLDSVKTVADTITEHTCKEDGVTEIIHKYLLG